VAVNPRLAGREWPIGLAGIATALALPLLALLASGDVAAAAGATFIAVVTALLAAAERTARAMAGQSESGGQSVEMLPAPVIGTDRVAVRPGSLLVSVRKPGALAQLAAALQSPAGRDVVVMTVRLLGVDASEEQVSASVTNEEERLLTDAAMMAE